jgi:hypothetical protein
LPGVSEAAAQRDLGALNIRYLFLDGWYPRVRIGKKRVRVHPCKHSFSFLAAPPELSLKPKPRTD